MLSGPCLNRILSTTLTLMRCERYLLIYDLVKAFLQVEIPEVDRYKLCFLWFRNVTAGDYSVVAYHFNRLPFGLKCSPFLLMISLYYILIVDTTLDSVKIKLLKRNLWNLIYMDNGAVISSDADYLQLAHTQLPLIFGKFKFQIQQCVTNCKNLQNLISESPQTESIVKLFGMQWHTVTDEVCMEQIKLDKFANTKRTVLQSIASNFDLVGLALPILNRARLFMQRLQCKKDLGWDDELSNSLKNEWINISNQANNAKPVAMSMFVGDKSDSYDLISFTDSSQEAYGCVLYIVNKSKNFLSFLSAKNRLVS